MGYFFKRQIRANVFLEYVAVFCVVVGVFIGMARYAKQGIQGNMKKAGETFGFGRQYSPK